MTDAQRIYRIIRPFASRADARYAAPRLARMSWPEFRALSTAARGVAA